jgi:hypothetical protein
VTVNAAAAQAEQLVSRDCSTAVKDGRRPVAAFVVGRYSD